MRVVLATQSHGGDPTVRPSAGPAGRRSMPLEKSHLTEMRRSGILAMTQPYSQLSSISVMVSPRTRL